jgi:hypothetical protein
LCAESLRSFRYWTISSANRDNLTSSFPILIPFISSSCLIALARNYSTTLNMSGESGHPCLLPDFWGNDFSFSPFSLTLAVGLSYIAFIILRHVPLFLVSPELLSWKDKIIILIEIS